MEHVTYGEGGYDPSQPDDNVVARVTVDDPPAEPVDPLDTLVDDLAKATTLAQVRDAAKAARAKRGR